MINDKKNKLFIFLLLFITFSFSFIGLVNADSYGISISTDKTGTLKSGDTVTVTFGISNVVTDYYVQKQTVSLYYDDSVFELIQNDNGKRFYEVRNGWEIISNGLYPGMDSEIVSCDDETKYIRVADASDNSLDKINAELVKWKLKVKDGISNQDSIVSVINDVGYKKEIKYTIHNASNNNYLANLKVMGHDISPEFDKNTLKYEVYVDYDVMNLEIDAAAYDSSATIKGIGKTSIAVGENKIGILVTAEDGSTRNYEVNVIRKEANDDSSLSKIMAIDSKGATIRLSFDKNTMIYSGDVPYDVSYAYFDLKCSGKSCEIEKVTPLTLEEGVNKKTFKVTAENGNEEEYTIVINKEMAPKKIDYLAIVLGGLLIASLIVIIILVIMLNKKKKTV